MNMLSGIPEHIRIGRARWNVQLKKAIADRCVSETKLAKKAGIAPQQIYNIISGDGYCRQTTFDKINAALEIKDARYYYWRGRRSDRLASIGL